MTTVLGNIHAKCNSSPLVSYGPGIPASVRRTAHTCTACAAMGCEGGGRKVGSAMASKPYNAQSPQLGVSASCHWTTTSQQVSLMRNCCGNAG